MSLLSDQRIHELTVLVIFASFGVLYLLIDHAIFVLSAVVGIGVALLSLLPVAVTHPRAQRLGARIGLFALLLVFVLPVGYLLPRLDWTVLSLFSVVLLIALAFVFLYYSLLLPMAVFGLRGRDRDIEVEPPYPTISVIVPAYNEVDCIGASIDALTALDYPAHARETIVVDDGSTDGTYREALAHADDSVTVLTKENGGKHTALNHGLDHATGELVVTIDADSLLEPDGLTRIASAFKDQEHVGAVAGDLSVVNRGSFITELQELEYVVGIQLFRRAFDLVGTVVVVPGAFGAFRREVLEQVGRFDGDTLTEDRDATVKILKAGFLTKAIDARCLTEAPETWRGLYKQRLRWYRGTIQTLRKHRDVFRRPELGFLYSFAFPLELITAVGVPLAGFVIVAAIALELLFGSALLVASLFAFFAGLQALVAAFAIRVGANDRKLVLMAPLFVIGYRQFLDVVMVKSVVDVLSKRDLSWIGPARTGRLGELLAERLDDKRAR